MQWSAQQDRALLAVRAWLKDKNAKQVFKLFGFAGTGKTTLAVEMAAHVKGRVLFGAYTGKACLVMRRKGCAGAATIHSMIYKFEDHANGQPVFCLNEDSDVNHAGLVIIDEVSMVDEELARDLLSFGTKILVLGDPFQLPPVKGTGYFMQGEPDVMLSDIHRQARDNPIIRLSMDVREGRRLQLGTYGDSRVCTRKDIDAHQVLDADQVIVGLNRTRRGFNARIRELKGFTSHMPERNDRLICLRNKRDKHLLNGGMWAAQKVGEPDHRGVIEMQVLSEDDPMLDSPVDVRVYQNFFLGTEEQLHWRDRMYTEEFDFGYAITCHKSQGSQYDDVMLFDEGNAFKEHANRWTYTGITRAAERVTVVI